jgi:hypothetical protein
MDKITKIAIGMMAQWSASFASAHRYAAPALLYLLHDPHECGECR